MQLVKLLKAFGITIEQQHIDAVQELVPKVPGLLQNATTVINNALQNFDQRLHSIEETQKLQHEELMSAVKDLKDATNIGNNRGSRPVTTEHRNSTRNTNSRG